MSDDEHDDLVDAAYRAINRLSADGRMYVLGVLTFTAPVQLLDAIDIAVDDDHGFFV